MATSEIDLINLDPAAVAAEPSVLTVQRDLNTGRVQVSLDIVSTLSDIPQPVVVNPVTQRLPTIQQSVLEIYHIQDELYVPGAGISLLVG